MVYPINDIPELISLESQITNEDEDLTIEICVPDPDIYENGQDLLFNASCNSNVVGYGGIAEIPSGGLSEECAVFVFHVDDNEYGNDECIINVDDQNGGIVSTSFSVTVNSVNDEPVLSAIGNQSTDEDNDLVISLSYSDPDIEFYGEQHTFT